MIFDHDGTLVDSEPITLGVLMDMAIEHGADVREGDHERFVGAHLHVVFDEIATRAGRPVPDDFIDVFRARQTTRIRQGLSEIPGATKVLECLSDRAIPFAVASNAPLAKLELCLTATGLDRFFPLDRRFSAYDIEVWKPAPDLFLHTAAEIGVNVERCAIVEDSPSGIQAAIASKATVFALDPDDRFAGDGVTQLSQLDELLQYM